MGTPDQAAVRATLGRALRRMRYRGHLSLDEVEQTSGEEGVRISRSHLSRVETGQADIALSRFLSLMHVLGYPASQAADELAPLVAAPPVLTSQPMTPSGLSRGGPEIAAMNFRRLALGGRTVKDPALLEAWGLAECALGRWQAAGRVFARSLPSRPAIAPAARLVVACLGQHLGGLARVLVSGIERENLEIGAVLRGACLLQGDGDPRMAARILSGLGQRSSASSSCRALSLALAAESYRRSRQIRAAVATAETACACSDSPVLRADLMRIHARTLGSLRRPQAGLRLLGKARALARDQQVPDLLVSIHLESERLWKLAGERDSARSARRAAAAMQRRMGADRRSSRDLPLQGLLVGFGS